MCRLCEILEWLMREMVVTQGQPRVLWQLSRVLYQAPVYNTPRKTR